MPARQGADSQPRAAPARRRPERLAFALSLAWLALVVALGWALSRRGTPPAETLVFVLVALAVFLPVVLIWQTVYLIRAARRMQEAAVSMAAQAEALAARQGPGSGEMAHGQLTGPQNGTGLRFTSRRHEAAVPAPAPNPADVAGAAQGALALAPREPEAIDIGHDELIRALHFPEDEDDTEGFAALRRALGNHATAELIRSAQAVLSGLALEGIYMDQLTPDRTRPEIWRAFALGTRGPAVAALAGVRDRSCLALSAARMRADPEFRDAVHRFLRAFDRCLRAFEPEASDAQIARLAETRSARAFMLLGRVAGVFR
ncbi:MAG: hypothetical protein JJT95_01870 [Pararhodobacter sp.]|nr:hypothetical protein [Pararhodobacter sp.]